MVETLKIGMSTEQVEYVLGSPLAVNPFDPKRWEYHYSVRLGADIKDRKHLVVVFDDNGQLRAIEGDYSAAAKPDVDSSAP
ncbi:outer membrane protein assembly factor BamE [bacterium]|nr:outer membrane protein assembly factor BamE [bacterium]